MSPWMRGFALILIGSILLAMGIMLWWLLRGEEPED